MAVATPLEAVVTCETSHEHLAQQLANSVNEAPQGEQLKLNELAFMVYDMVNGGNYGKGPFEVTMCAGETSFALTLTTVRR